MEKQSFYDELEFDETRVKTKVIVETSFSKEIRILLKSGQLMKEHKTAFPIIIHILDGSIELGVNKEILPMKKGDVIHLNSNIPHDLRAIENTIVRLTLSKHDSIERVKQVVED